MFLLSIDDVRPGMQPGVAIRTRRDGRDVMLVSASRRLTAKDIDRLRASFGVRSLWIRNSATKEIGELVNPAFEECHREILDAAELEFENVVAHNRRCKLGQKAYNFSASRHSIAIEKMIGSFIGDTKKLSLLAQINFSAVAPGGDAVAEPLPTHLARYHVNVAALACALGIALQNQLFLHKKSNQAGQSAKTGASIKNVLTEIRNLVVAALSADVGFLHDDLHGVAATRGKWQTETWQQSQKHVLLGTEMLRRCNFNPVVLATVLQSHQRYDGRGYPKVMRVSQTEMRTRAKNEIYLLARIVKIAGDYVDLVMYRGMLPVQALCFMSEHNRAAYDPEIKRYFDGIVMPYPVGELVVLSNGTVGIVSDFHPEKPCRPTVFGIGASDGRGAELKGRTIDLTSAEFEDLCVKLHRGVDVSGYDFAPGKAQQMTALETDILAAFSGTGEEIRRSMRETVQVAAYLKSGIVALSGVTGDISRHGVFMIVDAKLRIGTVCELTLALIGADKKIAGRLETEVRVARVVNTPPAGLGLEFTRPNPPGLEELIVAAKRASDKINVRTREKTDSPVTDSIAKCFLLALSNTLNFIAAHPVGETEFTAAGDAVAKYGYYFLADVAGDLDGTIAVSFDEPTLTGIMRNLSSAVSESARKNKKDFLSQCANFFAGIAQRELAKNGLTANVNVIEICHFGKSPARQKNAPDAFTLTGATASGPFAMDFVLSGTAAG